MNPADPHDPEHDELPPDAPVEPGPVSEEGPAAAAEPATETPAPGDVIEGETPAEPGPVPAAPPRVVAETPVGGRLPPVLPPRPETVIPPAPPAAASEPEPPPPSAPLESQPEAAVPAEPAPAAPPAEVAAPGAVPPAPQDEAAPQEWDDELSPELAAVLFGAKTEAPAAPPADREAPVPRPAPAARVVSAPAAPAGESIVLTDIADARRLPISAQGMRSPAPGDQPGGRARYVRVEEPLRGDKGQRITESWEYQGPDLPALEGRSIRHVRIEEITYADGSWYWTFERQYADKGRDRREVRASKDRAYIERADEVTRKDPAMNKRVRGREQAQMILSAAGHEEKRGFLSGLLGKDDEEAGPRAWRPAEPKEASRARKHGGDAF